MWTRCLLVMTLFGWAVDTLLVAIGNALLPKINPVPGGAQMETSQ